MAPQTNNGVPLMDPNSAAEAAIRQRMQESKEFIHTSNRDLAPIAHRGRLPENEFVNRFLPYFTGQVQASPEQPFVNLWVAIAGSPTSEVDIIDPATGQVLYSTPPLFDTSLLDTVPKPGSPTLGQIMRDFKNMEQDTPDVAKSFLDRHLEHRLGGMFKAPDAGFQTDRWTKIAERYGVKPPEDPAEKAAQAQANRDDIDYDAIE